MILVWFEVLFVRLMLYLRNNDIGNFVFVVYLLATNDEEYFEL